MGRNVLCIGVYIIYFGVCSSTTLLYYHHTCFKFDVHFTAALNVER